MKTTCLLEYWGARSWRHGHAGVDLADPATYVRKLAQRGVIARATELDTGTVHQLDGADLL